MMMRRERHGGTWIRFVLVHTTLLVLALSGVSGQLPTLYLHESFLETTRPVVCFVNLTDFRPPSGALLPIGTTCSMVQSDQSATYFKIRTATTTPANRIPCLLLIKSVDYDRGLNFLSPLLACVLPKRETLLWSVSVRINGTNDEAPVISVSKQNVFVPETTNIGAVVTSLSVTDPDLPPPSEVISVALNPASNPNGTFSINQNADPTAAGSYKLQLAKKLDYETLPFYSLSITATDLAGHKTSALINVTVLDGNDEAPQFTQPKYSVAIAENASLYSPVIQLQAIDADSKAVTNLRYSLRYSGLLMGQSLLKVGPLSGAVLTNTTQLPVGVHQFVAVVSDGVHTDQVPFELNVTDVNDQPPVITRSCLQLVQFEEPGPPSGTVICTFTINDADYGDNGRVNIQLDGGQGVFSLSTNDTVRRTTPVAVSVLITSVLNYEKTNVYHLTLEVSDNGYPSQRAKLAVTVYVNDSNEHAPRFEYSLYQVSIPENTLANDLVATVKAVDPDGLPSAITYHIVNVSDSMAMGWFHIDSSTGLLKVSGSASLDREVLPTVTLVIEAQDTGTRNGAQVTLTSTAIVRVTLLDVNDNRPSFSNSSYIGDIIENAVDGAAVLQLTATDSDEGANGTVIYSLSAANGSSAFPFTINKDGEIKVAAGGQARLDRETQATYNLTATASDLGNPRETTSVPVRIDLLDVNDNAPVFYPPTYHCSIVENSGPGKVCTTVSAQDSDAGAFGQVAYTIVSGNIGNVFVMNKTSGQLSTRQSLDRETIDSYTLVIQAQDSEGLVAGTNATVGISVTNLHDRPPKFKMSSYVFNVTEDASINTTIGSVVAVRQDAKPNPPELMYAISGGDRQGVFFITRLNGSIHVAQRLDRETVNFFSLEITVVETGSPPLYATTTVKIILLDVNDNAPSFGRASDRASVLECAPIGFPIYQANATDTDLGKSARVRYAIVTSSVPGFAMNRTTGILTLSKNVLDHERERQEFVTIKAADRGPQRLTSTLNLTIVIQDCNDNAPQFMAPSYFGSIVEGTALSTSVLTVTATDRDSLTNGTVTYTLVNASRLPFDIYPSNGTIYVSNALDREQRDKYILTVLATDGNHPPLISSVHVLINVTDTNDLKPIFDQPVYNFTVQEYEPLSQTPRLPSPLGNVHATDGDLGMNSKVRYRLASGSSLFKVDPITGNLSVISRLDREGGLGRMLTFRVLATDQGFPSQLSSFCTVHAIITDVNDNPPVFTRPPQGTVATANIFENVSVGYLVYTVQTQDHDSGDNSRVTYSWAKADSSSEFYLNSTTGAIRVRSTLDFEGKNVIELKIKAEDHGQPVLSSTATVRVIVMDVNDVSPSFLNSSNVTMSVLESTDLYSVIAQFVATDKETVSNGNGKIRYAISSGNEQGMFSINSLDGTISLVKPLNYSHTPNYSLMITAKDSPVTGMSRSASLTFFVNVLPYTDTGPYFRMPQMIVDVLENASTGHMIAKLQALDRDPGKNGVLRYTLISETASGNGMSSVPSSGPHFAVNSMTGWLSVQSSLDYETTPLYTLIVMATDQSPNERNATATVIVRVQNTNEFRPIVPRPQHLILPENEVTGRVIYTVIAQDQDSGIYGQIAYAFLRGNSTLSPTDNLFSINVTSGKIILTHSLDYEARSWYKLVIRCTDSAGAADGLYSDLQLNVTIQDVNDNAPKFTSSKYFTTVRENLPAGTIVVDVNATDSDSGLGGQIVYILANGGDGAFKINSQTGMIRTTKPLDRENISNYSLTIVAKDRGNPVLLSSTSVLVNVGDDNDHPPVFFKGVYALSVTENTNKKSMATLLAVDHDIGTNGKVQYSLVGGNIGDVFKITPSGGLLVVKKPLDRENVSRYLLTVQICDSPLNKSKTLCSTAQINVTVIDDNDNYPIFQPTTYSSFVPENATIGYSVLQVTATDKDTGSFGKVHYAMNDPSGKFAINSTTGVIRVSGHLDHEDLATYTLPVRAIDSDPHGPRSSTTLITIGVLDVNEFPPTFTQSEYTVNISERIIAGSRVINMTAIDIDSGKNALVMYTFISPNSNFAIDPSTGMVTTRRNITAQSVPFVLSILAKDSGSPSLNASARLLINVLSVLQTPPRFLQDLKIVYRQGDISANSIIDKLEAITDDPTIVLNYELLSVMPTTAAASFAVSTVAGNVRTLTAVTFARNSIYKLNVQAFDPLQPSSSAKMTLQIQVSALQHVFLHFLPPLNASFPESIPVNKRVLTVRASSDFEQTNPRYSIIAGNNNNTFRIVSHSGEIFTNKKLDYETKSFYSLSVLATDLLNFSRPSIGTVSFRLTDVNDNKPFWVRRPTQPVQVLENAQVTSAVAQVQAEDRDSDAISYFLENNLGFYFTISPTGEISLARPLDYERKQNYSLVAVARDRDYVIKTTVNVDVIDINDNAPIFALQTQTKFIKEKSQRGIVIAQVTATDADTGLNGQVRYKLGDTYNNTFTINTLTGNITLLRSLTYNKTDNLYFINVIAFDAGQPRMESTESVIVEVMDINDHSPVFTKPVYNFSIKENTTIQSVIGEVRATDEDSGLNALLAYGIVKGSRMFAMNQNDGTIYLLRALDRELIDHYQFNVSVTDGGQPEQAGYALVNVLVEDVNDNAPQFDKTEYTVRVQEDFRQDRPLVQVHATDADLGNKSKVVYSITEGNIKSAFSISMETGQIFSLIPLAPTGARRLVITARDSAPPYHISTVRVNIIVFKSNQCEPIFTSKIYFRTIVENTLHGHLVMSVKAVVLGNKTNTIVYGFANGTSDEVKDAFALNSTSGILTVKTQPDYERTRQFHFTVQAANLLCPNRISSANVNISIRNINENRPVFRQAEYQFKVPPGTAVNSVVATVSAIDSDAGSHLRYYFDKINNEKLAGTFSIDANSGQISLIKSVKNEQATRVINGTVIAWDGEWNATAPITLTIKPVNEVGAVNSSSSSSMLVIIVVIIALFFALVVVICIFLLLRRRNKTDKHHQISSGFAYADANNRPGSSRGLLNQSTSISSAPSTSHRFDSTSSEAPLVARKNTNKLAMLGDDSRVPSHLTNGSVFYDSPATNTTSLKLSSMPSSSASNDHSFHYRVPFSSTEHEQIHEFGEEGAGEAFGGMGGGGVMDVNTVLYHKLAEIEAEEYEAVMDGTRCFTAEGVLAADKRASSLGSVYKLADDFVAQGHRSWLEQDFKGMDDAFLELADTPSSKSDQSSVQAFPSSRVAKPPSSAKILSVEVKETDGMSSNDDFSVADNAPILHTPPPIWAKSPPSTKPPIESSTQGQFSADSNVTKQQRQDALDELIGNFDTDNDSGSDNDGNIRILSDYEPEEV